MRSFFWLAVVASSVPLVAASPAGETDAYEPFRARLAEAGAEGASGVVAVRLRGGTVFEAGFGSARCDGGEPVTPEHVFMIGSITKELTKVLGWVLEERGALSFEDPLSAHLDGISGPIASVTVGELLDHTGGLPDLIDAEGRPVEYTVEYDYEPVDREGLVARASKATLDAAQRGEEHYSNLGYQLLAAVYEAAAGEPFPDLLRRYIYSPAGMTGTDYWFEDATDRSFADGCRGGERWGNPIDDGMWGAQGPSWNLIGAGGLLSTAESLGRFLEAIGSGDFFESEERSDAHGVFAFG